MPHVVSDDIYIAELMVESNVTLDAQTILSILNSTTDLQVNDAQGVTYTVTLLQNELVAGIVQNILSFLWLFQTGLIGRNIEG